MLYESKNFPRLILGNPKHFSMENRFFNLITIFISIAGFANAMVEYYLDLPLRFYLFAFLVAVVSGSFYLYNRFTQRYKHLVWPLLILGYIIVVYDWYFLGGLSGVSLQMGLAFIAVIPVLMGKKQIYIALGVIIITVLSLYFIEDYNPKFPNYYPNRELLLQDLVTTFIVLSIILVIGISIIVHSYQRENARVAKGNISLQNMNTELEKKNIDLKKALEEIEELSGFLPICASCKKIRDDKRYWNRIESYIETHTKASFSHSMCPECSDKLYGDQDWYINRKKKQQ